MGVIGQQKSAREGAFKRKIGGFWRIYTQIAPAPPASDREHGTSLSGGQFVNSLPQLSLDIDRPRRKFSRSWSKIQAGVRFGRLVVTGPPAFHHRTPCGSQIYHVPCRCDCGREVDVRSQSLQRGLTTSCGCYNREAAKSRGTTHGGSKDKRSVRLFNTWMHMRARCNNRSDGSFGNYGGRGISVCEEWQDFGAFRDWSLANDYGETLTIDRIDNDLGYSPDNCRWTTMRVQCNNKSNNAWIEAWGETKTLTEWSRDPRCRVCRGTLSNRLQTWFWEPEYAISTPPLR